MDPVGAAESGFYQDPNRLKNIQGQAGLHAAAKEFEALFLQMVLKNMREASHALADKDNPFDSRQQQFYQSMADGQMASMMAGKAHVGIAEAIDKQWNHLVPETASLKNSENNVATTNVAAFQQPLKRR
ncbi:rod-binding protein [Gallaecimonas mangrovi]|uniref:rod-binding protein n=1 Tax=Gallaecimonas mangrovi TaxID=2291597 RepID=UPI000E208779|nr:rod-binding protein [Gallaecimonas mangrovi]